MSVPWLCLGNGEAAPVADVPEMGIDVLAAAVASAVREERLRISSLFGAPEPGSSGVRLYAVLADDAVSQLRVGSALVADGRYPSLTPACPQAHWFEREIAEQFGLVPEGHPWLKPIRFHAPLWSAEGRPLPAAAPPLAGDTTFFRVEGEEVHEVAVGPVHAGVIEPGHFRFQCHGELVMHLEISLGYQHRGVERALLGGPGKRSIHQIETAAGDTSVGHALAHCQVLEALGGGAAPPRGQALRGVALELERLANHTGDLGALAGDVAFLPTASFCGRLRGDFLNMTAELCGNRFGRGLVRPGGVRFDADQALADRLLDRLDRAAADVREAAELLWDTPTVLARFESTGAVAPELCEEVGLVGPAARACGIPRDVRHDFPSGIYRYVHLPVMTAPGGDVNGRALVRWLEIQQSVEFVQERLRKLPATAPRSPVGSPAPAAIAVGLVEGWRGEICHVAITDDAGRFLRYKVTDPSFHNWFGLALALRGAEISDFPLCNKSFNLSYCGHDL